MSSNATTCITTVGRLCTACQPLNHSLCAACQTGYRPNAAGTACVITSTTTTSTRAPTPTILPTRHPSGVAAVQSLYVALMTLCLIIVAMFVR